MANGTFYAVVEFEDGLQVIPTNWLDINVMKAVWPNFTNSKRCDKAVKFMEEPESTWMKHPVRKVYGRYFNYAVAKKKLKNVEVLSKLNSDTEREEFLKKTRKIRAAKIMDTSTSSSEELSNDSFILDVPTISNVSTKRHYSMITQKPKIAKDAQKGLQKRKNIVLFDDALNSTTVYDCDYNSQDPQCSKNPVNIEDICHWNDNRIMTMLRDNDHNSDPLSILNSEYTQNLPNIKQEITRNSDNEDNVSVPLVHDMAVLDFEQKSENFQRFIIQKLNNLEMKINRIENNMNANHKIILQKLAISNIEVEEKEDIDVFEDLPLKDEANLMLMETKLKNDLWYRNQMIKQLTRITCENIKTSCIRLMRAILSNELAMKYSWYGAKKKQVFSQLEICKVIINVIRKLHTDVTDEQIAAPIKVWLVHAKERFGKQSENELEKLVQI